MSHDPHEMFQVQTYRGAHSIQRRCDPTGRSASDKPGGEPLAQPTGYAVLNGPVCLSSVDEVEQE
jgi:hypothetical protein